MRVTNARDRSKRTVEVVASVNAKLDDDGDEVPFVSFPFPLLTSDVSAASAMTAPTWVSRPTNSTNLWHSQSMCLSYATDSWYFDHPCSPTLRTTLVSIRASSFAYEISHVCFGTNLKKFKITFWAFLIFAFNLPKFSLVAPIMPMFVPIQLCVGWWCIAYNEIPFRVPSVDDRCIPRDIYPSCEFCLREK